MSSFLEKVLEADLRKAGISFEREVRFHPPRRWRFDFVLPDRIAVEVEGGTMGKSRHTSGLGFDRDTEKYNQAVLDGYRVLRFTSRAVKAGEVIPLIKALIDESPGG